MLNYNHLYYFHVTATEGTVARAAERLGVGQPTVSEQVRALERNLGTSLFERTGGKLRLTEAGRGAFEHTTVMFRAGERLVEGLREASSPPPVSLRVGISSAIARTIATDFLMPLFALDDCIPSVRMGEAHDLLRELRAHQLELLLCETDPGQAARAGLQLVAIDRPRLVAVTRPPATVHPGWDDVALVHYRASSVYRAPIDDHLDEHNLHPKIAAETDDALVMLTAVLRGGFTAFLPWSVAREAVRAGTLAVIAELQPPDIAVHALHHDDAGAAIARRAVELLLEHTQAGDPA